MRGTCQRFATNRSALTEVTKSVSKVSESLREMRDEVLNVVDDLVRNLERAGDRESYPVEDLATSADPFRQAG